MEKLHTQIQRAMRLVRELAKVYTVDTDQAELIRLVSEAKKLVTELNEEEK
jgi:hypothetical protein